MVDAMKIENLKLPSHHEVNSCVYESVETTSAIPHPKAVERCFIESTIKGTWYYAPPFPQLLDSIKFLLRKIGRKHDFEEWLFPRLLSPEELKQFGCIEDMSSILLSIQEVRPQHNLEAYLDPVQCAAFYAFLKRNRPDHDICPPLKMMELGSCTYRNEREEELTTGVKTREFFRAEFVFMDSPVEVMQLRTSMIQSLTDLLSQWGWRWRLMIGQGCYERTPPEIVDAVENAQGLGELPVLDIEVWDPSSGKWIELVGCTNFRDEKLRRFGIQSPGYWSGCVGVGLTRFLYLFGIYHGIHAEDWPSDIVTINNALSGL